MKIKNWKTTLGGVIVAIGTFLPYTGIINEKQGNLIIGLGTTIGLSAAKDKDVTGGTRGNTPKFNSIR